MNTSIVKISTIVAVAMALVLTGCRSSGNGDADAIGDDVLISSIDGDGLAVTGLPFDESRTRLSNIVVEPLYFGYDSFVLPPAEISKVQNVVAILQQNPNYVMIIEGHCDERGSNEYNLSLGEQRALAVRNYIIDMGIAAERIQSRSFGEERPAVQGTGEGAWSLNRRGEFAFFQ
jgi:peptidoglycan-associated lipoprotein